MIFNSMIITKLKLIDLIQSGKKTENIKLKSPILCVLIFLLSVAGLGFAYYQVGWNFNRLDQKKFLIMIAIGLVTTVLIFWSVSGMLLRVVMSMKKMYYKNLNSFTFRQISSKINTTVLSMSVICLMLFITICALSSALSIRNSMNANLKELCPADFEIEYQENATATTGTISEIYASQGYDITAHIADYVNFYDYKDETFTMEAFFGENCETIRESFPLLDFYFIEPIVKLSDYNALMELYGREQFSLNDDEFMIICNYNSSKTVYDEYLNINDEITVFGNVLKSKYDACQDGFIDIASQPINAGIFIVPDNAVDENYKNSNYFIGNYNANSKEDKNNIEKIFIENYYSVITAWRQNLESGFYLEVNTKIDISEATIGLGAIVTFLGLYIGLVFLISCGVILALKQLSDSVDSISRYAMLRKIGVEESDISKSLFAQTGIFFLLPLLLASIHSIFGMKFSVIIL
ncbi:MAG: ABC transporter permease, partial [Oscillospiraceae bacterium]|nr:ABC transporter permease [Oscillospiraceae bacterium]